MKYTYAARTQYKTALGMAYAQYISARKCFEEHDAYTQNAKKCLDLLVEATEDYLYREGLKQFNEELFINKAIHDLAGNFRDIYDESNSDAVKKLLEQSVKPAVLARIRTERIHAFCMGSNVSQAQQERKVLPPEVHRFFQNDGRHDLTREIFSYVHPVKKINKRVAGR